MNFYDPVFTRADLFLTMFVMAMAAMVVCVYIYRMRSAEVAALQKRLSAAESKLQAMSDVLDKIGKFGGAQASSPPNEYGAAG